MNCPSCCTAMRRGAVQIKNNPWRFLELSITGDRLYFFPNEGAEKEFLIQNGDVRDAFHCNQCGTTVLFDGRKVSPG